MEALEPIFKYYYWGEHARVDVRVPQIQIPLTAIGNNYYIF